MNHELAIKILQEAVKERKRFIRKYNSNETILNIKSEITQLTQSINELKKLK